MIGKVGGSNKVEEGGRMRASNKSLCHFVRGGALLGPGRLSAWGRSFGGRKHPDPCATRNNVLRDEYGMMTDVTVFQVQDVLLKRANSQLLGDRKPAKDMSALTRQQTTPTENHWLGCRQVARRFLFCPRVRKLT